MTKELLHELETRGKEEGTLPELLEFYHGLLQIQLNAEPRLDALKTSLTDEAVSRRLEQGLPALGFTELGLDWDYLKEIFAQIIDLFTEYRQLFNISEAVDSSKYRLPWLRKAVRAWYEGTELPPGAVDARDEHHLADVLQATLKPFLAVYRKAWLPLVNQESWRRGYCPVCGGSPDLALLDKERGARWLICSRCDAEWLFQRMKCPYCGTEDQNALAYFTDDEGRYRLYVCEQCRQYIKTIDLRLTESEIQLPLERLFTLSIDAQAQEQGYKAGRRITTTNPHNC